MSQCNFYQDPLLVVCFPALLVFRHLCLLACAVVPICNSSPDHTAQMGATVSFLQPQAFR